MKNKLKLIVFLVIAFVFTIAVIATPIISPALNIIAKNNKMIKSGLIYSDIYFSEQDFKKIIKTFLSFERVDKSWAKRLKAIDKVFNKTTAENLSHYCEQFLVNSVYRHLSDAEDTMWVRARTISTVFSWWIIKSIIAKEQVQNKDNFDLIVDIIRAYSTEVEYSQKNLDKLYLFAYKFIKI